MYETTGRERVHARRFSRYTVRFSTPWPGGSRKLYIVSTFTSLYPGRFEMVRFKDRGFITLNLWPGLYPYWFSVNGLTSIVDEENEETVYVKLVDWENPLRASPG